MYNSIKKSNYEVINLKIITVCGSFKFKDEVMDEALKLELAGNCVLTPIFSSNTIKENFTDEQYQMLDKMHKEKIKLSDAIFVVDINNYIGSSTKSEIEYAKSLNKEILYFSDTKN